MEKGSRNSFGNKNKAGTGPCIPVRNKQTCQYWGRVQTKHSVLQPMRADFQKQVVECGKVNDKGCRESTAQSTQATYYFSTYIASSFDCAQDLQTFAFPILTEWQTEKQVKFKDKLDSSQTPHTQLETSKKRDRSGIQKMQCILCSMNINTALDAN